MRHSKMAVGLLLSLFLFPAIVFARPPGFKILSVQKGSVFEQMGFQNGDVILSINDKSMHSSKEFERTFKKLRELKSGEELTVKLKRSGHTETLHYSIK